MHILFYTINNDFYYNMIMHHIMHICERKGITQLLQIYNMKKFIIIELIQESLYTNGLLMIFLNMASFIK